MKWKGGGTREDIPLRLVSRKKCSYHTRCSMRILCQCIINVALLDFQFLKASSHVETDDPYNFLQLSCSLFDPVPSVWYGRVTVTIVRFLQVVRYLFPTPF